jgi:hypothetical protein
MKIINIVEPTIKNIIFSDSWKIVSITKEESSLTSGKDLGILKIKAHNKENNVIYVTHCTRDYLRRNIQLPKEIKDMIPQ